MSRDQELSKHYAELAKMAAVEKNDTQYIVDGDWYLFEQDGQFSVVHSTQHLAEYQYTLEKMRKLGWTVTPITLVRKS